MSQRVLIVGGGTMGAGIAQLFLERGAEVWLTEVSREAALHSCRRIEGRLIRRQFEQACERLHTLSDASTRVPFDLAIEAVPEVEALKLRVLATMEDMTEPDTLIATNTSSLSINSLAKALAKPSRFLGMHFFNPVPTSALVEIVFGSAAAPEQVERARHWVSHLNKTAIVVRDSPGFATSRLGVILGLEAIRMLEEGVASPTDIDLGMKLGYGFPMGPLRVTDIVGLDVRLAIAEHLSEVLGARFDPPKLLRDKVAAGELGKKTGEGFFRW